MNARKFSRFLSLFLAMMVLGIALGAKIPTSKCHCRERQKPVTAHCPFGELRQLGGSLLVPPDSHLEPVSFSETELPSFTRVRTHQGTGAVAATRARSPPAIQRL